MTRYLLLLVALSSCTFATRPMLLTFQREGGTTDTGWVKIETSNFTLVTDLSSGDAHEAAQDIAGELEAVEAALGNTQPRIENKLIIVVYENGLDFEKRFGRAYQSMTKYDPKTSELTIFLWGRSTRWVHHNMVGQNVAGGSPLRQTLTHAALSRQIPATALPSWFKHGMGAYIDTLAWSEDGKSIEVGAANVQNFENYINDRSVGFTDVIGPQRDHPGQQEAYMHAFDGYCWALIFTAVNKHSDGLARYIEALGNGPADPTMIFDGATPDAIDAEVQLFLKHTEGEYARRTVTVDSHEIPAKVTAITAEELAHYSPPLK